MLMQCNFEAMEIWEAIEPGGAGVKRSQDRQARGRLLCKEIFAYCQLGYTRPH